jgi:hypothetical protein
MKNNPRVAFFAESNPDWREGVELACIARMTLVMPVHYAIKVFLADRVIGPVRRSFALTSAKKEARTAKR